MRLLRQYERIITASYDVDNLYDLHDLDRDLPEVWSFVLDFGGDAFCMRLWHLLCEGEIGILRALVLLEV